MSRLSPFISRPEDISCCFWEILLLLAGEPAFEFLREALSAPPGSANEASSVDSPHRADVSVAEMSESGFGAAEDLPHEEDGEGATGGQVPGSFSPHPVGRWSIQALRILERSGHPRIWKIYYGGLVLFIAYRAMVRFPSVWPIPGHQIRGFLLSLDSEDVSAPRILTYLSGLSYLSHTFNFQDPLQDLFTSHMIICMKWQQEPPIPLNVETLESVLGALESICDGMYECLMFRAVFLLSFHAALRPKEIVAKTCTTFHPELLCLDDIELGEVCVGLHITAAEMGAGRFTYWLRPSVQPWLCPVLALKNYLAVRPRGEGPLFLYGNWRLLCKRRFLDVFHGALRRLNLPTERYCIRSFWLGSLTNAVSCSFPERIILQLARWPCRPLPGRPGVNSQP